MKISKRAVINKGVSLGVNCIIEDFVIIGSVPVGHKGNIPETIIGDNAIIRSHTNIYAGNVIGKNFNTGNKCNIRESNNIGDYVSVGTLSVVEHHVKIGANVRIHTQAFIPEYCVLEDGAWIGPNVVLTNAKYPRSRDAKNQLMGVIIGKNAKLGANCTVLPGVIIGENALVGAGSVVTKNVKANSVMAGNPAKAINKIKNLPY